MSESSKRVELSSSSYKIDYSVADPCKHISLIYNSPTSISNHHPSTSGLITPQPIYNDIVPVALSHNTLEKLDKSGSNSSDYNINGHQGQGDSSILANTDHPNPGKHTGISRISTSTLDTTDDKASLIKEESLKRARMESHLEFRKEIDRNPVAYSFTRNRQCLDFLDLLVKQQQFYIGDIRRQVNHLIYEEMMNMAGHDVSGQRRYAIKADGMNVRDMVMSNPLVFSHGVEELESDSHKLKALVTMRYHKMACHECRPLQEGSILPSCYFNKLYKCLTHGWKPHMTSDKFHPPYSVTGNYKSTECYPDSVNKEVMAMLENNVIRRCLPTRGQVVHPIGAVVKSSDKTRAKALVNEILCDQASLDRVNLALTQMGLNKVKVRVSTDCTGTGVNGAAYSPRFSYPSFREVIRIIERDCYMGVSDVGRYFNSFPWAKEMREIMRYEWQGQLYEYLGLCFGYSVCPYYCSAWSAEIRTWMKHLQYECTHMVDDWLFVAKSREEAILACEQLASILIECGFHMAVEKNEYGQSLKFLGIIFDSTTMTMRIDSVQSMGTRLLLEECLSKLDQNLRIEDSTVRHIAGKLNWFSEILQSGQLHIRSWWDYLRVMDRQEITAKLIVKLKADTKWWIQNLLRWEAEESAPQYYRILSSNELKLDPYAMYIVQSDASGDDGYGYYHGYRTEQNLKYFSTQWINEIPTSTHVMELTSLLDFVERFGANITNVVLVWITDNTGAAMSVNKGSCANIQGLELLTQVLEQCDARKIELVSLWVPREENRIGDYLSHLSCLLNRSQVAGSLEELAEQSHPSNNTRYSIPVSSEEST